MSSIDFKEGRQKKRGRKKGRRGTRPGHGWITSSTRGDKWTAEWERTPWDQIEYGLLLPGFIAVGYPKWGSHKLTQLKRGVGWGSLLLFVYRECHRRTKQTASHCCQQGSFREYTQTDVKGCDISASPEHVAREGGGRPQICAAQVPTKALLSLTDVTGACGSMNIWKIRLVNLTQQMESFPDLLNFFSHITF